MWDSTSSKDTIPAMEEKRNLSSSRILSSNGQWMKIKSTLDIKNVHFIGNLDKLRDVKGIAFGKVSETFLK